MLTIQYRMHDRIMEWSSQEFYEGKLRSHPSVATHLLSGLISPTPTPNATHSTGDVSNEGRDNREDRDINGLLEVPMLMIDSAGCDMEESPQEEGESIGNEHEVKIVLRHVQALLHAGVSNRVIGVITPYNAQVNILRAALHSYDVEVATVDGFQGREKEAIVMSMVRSNGPPHNVGFLQDERRTNVAITRARRHVCVICDSETLGSYPFLKRMVDYFAKYAVVLSATDYMTHECSELLYQPNLSEDTTGVPAAPVEKTKKVRKPQVKKQKNPKTNERKEGAKGVTDEQKAKWVVELTELRDKIGKYSILDHINFPPSLNSYERMVLHELSSQLGLHHESVGEDKDRKLVIKRPDDTAHSHRPLNPAESHQIGKIEKNVHGRTETNIKTSERPQKESKKTKAKIPVDPFADEVGEGNTDVAGPNSGAPTNTSQKKSKKNKAKTENQTDTLGPAEKSDPSLNDRPVNTQKVEKSTSLPVPQKPTDTGKEENIDEIVKQLGMDNSRCRIGGCTNSIIISRTCEFCKSKYCIYHGLPEAHGCGDAAKKKARSDWLKQTGPQALGGKPKEKPLKDWERNYVKNKLHKKLEDDAKARTAKQPPKKKK